MGTSVLQYFLVEPAASIRKRTQMQFKINAYLLSNDAPTLIVCILHTHIPSILPRGAH